MVLSFLRHPAWWKMYHLLFGKMAFSDERPAMTQGSYHYSMYMWFQSENVFLVSLQSCALRWSVWDQKLVVFEQWSSGVGLGLKAQTVWETGQGLFSTRSSSYWLNMLSMFQQTLVYYTQIVTNSFVFFYQQALFLPDWEESWFLCVV